MFKINDNVIINEKGLIGTICDIGYVRSNRTLNSILYKYEVGTPTIWGMNSKSWISAEIIHTLNKHIIRDNKIMEVLNDI